jgi:spore germination protein YaaH
MMLGGWLPYWRCAQSTESAQEHLSLLDQVSPFSYEVDNDLNLVDTFKSKAGEWKKFYQSCRKKNIKIIPTIFWTDTAGLHKCLSRKKQRDKHINQIMQEVITHHFDGININYERVRPEDRNYFITFIKDLSGRLHAKKLMLCCSVGGRTSDTSVKAFYDHTIQASENEKQRFIGFNWSKPALKTYKPAPTVSLSPGKGRAAQKYKKLLVKYCDQIHVMGYDEWGLPCKHSDRDLKDCYYISHCSNRWLEQIIQYALSYISPEKIVLGIPTYGLEFAVQKENDDLIFKKVRNVTFPRAQNMIIDKKITPSRSSGNELTFTYMNGDEKRYVCYLDGHAIKSKIDYARKYGLKGVYIFKIDGLEDTNMWKLLEQNQT